jgi:SPP1 family predicted phage head-tail adaptor
MALQFNKTARRQAFSSDPGRLDRRVTIQYSVPSRDASGGAVLDWYDAATVWASLSFLSGNRLYAAEEKSFEAMATYRIRHRSDVQTGMRLIHGDDVFEIVAVDQLGRRHFLEMTCRAINQSTGDNRDDLNLGDGVTFLDLGDGRTTLTRGGAIAA